MRGYRSKRIDRVIERVLRDVAIDLADHGVAEPLEDRRDRRRVARVRAELIRTLYPCSWRVGPFHSSAARAPCASPNVRTRSTSSASRKPTVRRIVAAILEASLERQLAHRPPRCDAGTHRTSSTTLLSSTSRGIDGSHDGVGIGEVGEHGDRAVRRAARPTE